MKLVSVYQQAKPVAALYVQGKCYALGSLSAAFSNDMNTVLGYGPSKWKILKKINEQLDTGVAGAVHVKNAQLVAPVPFPGSCRDGYAFRQHVESARKNRGLSMLPEYDQYPVLYLTNHRTICGPGNIDCMPDHFEGLDFELEVAAVIGKGGKNIRAAEADKHIAGLMIMNDMSARTLQMEEMLLSLGPCKGKDFATATGPWLVTTDELAAYEVKAKPGHTGKSWKLDMRCSVNGRQLSQGNLADMDWTFAELIERASYGCELHPGDIIGSGTVGTGCLLELNGTARLRDPRFEARWLKEGDVIEMDVTGLGKLKNTIRAVKSQWSILSNKKLNQEVA